MDIITLALAKKYTKDTAIQFGAVKGANCKISKVEDVGDTTEITFYWKNDADETKTSKAVIPHGVEGVSVTNVELNDSNHVIVTLSDGTEIDAGVIDTAGVLEEALTATVAIGSVTVGKTYAIGTKLEKIIRDMLIKEEAPGITIALDPSTLVYDVVTDTLSRVKISAVVTKKTYAPKSVKFYAGTTEIHSVDISGSGTYSYQYTPASAINSDTKFKVVVADDKFTNSAEKLVQFVPRSYWGIVAADVVTPVESDIKGLANNGLKTTKGLTYSDITMVNSKIVYAYPKSFGALTSIVSKEGYDYMSSYTRSETTVDGIDYYVYTLTVAATIETAGYKQIFA